MTTTMDPTPPPMPPPPTPPPGPRRRLVRSTSDRLLGGVAGGVAQTYGVDAALVRVLFAVAGAFTIGFAAFAYAIAWIVIPSDEGRVVADDLVHGAAGGNDRRRWRWFGIGLVIFGLLALADVLDDHNAWWGAAGSFVPPMLLLAAGAAVLLARRDPSSPDPAAASPATTTPTSPMSATSPTPAPPVPRGTYPPPQWPVAATAPWVPAPAPKVRQSSRLGHLTLSVVLLVAGGAWLLDLVTGDVPAAVVAAICLAVLGAGLLVGGWVGRARWLILPAALLTVVCALVAVLDVPLEGGVGERIRRPATAASLRDGYRLGVGRLVLDLRGIDAATEGLDRDRTVTMTNAIGELEVIVPAGLHVRVVAETDLGEITLEDGRGFAFDDDVADGTDVRRTATYGPADDPLLTIEAHVGIGAIQIRSIERPEVQS